MNLIRTITIVAMLLVACSSAPQLDSNREYAAGITAKLVNVRNYDPEADTIYMRPCIQCRVDRGEPLLSTEITDWRVEICGRVIPIQKITTQITDPERVNIYGEFRGVGIEVYYKGQEVRW